MKFGDIRRVGVRDFWPNEAADFTPWLAEEENITRLSKAVGFELEVENTEVAVGPYSADIVAKDTGTGEFVVIENQLGKTDHDHLGKLLTYGSVLDAGAVIWIAGEFTEEHEKAMNWLNDKTSDGIAFYGVLLEVLKIDESLPAVQFSVVSRPAQARRSALAAASAPLSPTKKLQLEFWTAVQEKLLDDRVLSSPRTPRPQYWYNLSIGRTGFSLSSIADTWEKKIGVRVYLRSAIADAALEELTKQKNEIEAEIGQPLQWNPNPDNRDKIIALYRKADISERDRWPEYCDWMSQHTKKIRDVFMPRIRDLVLDDSTSDVAD